MKRKNFDINIENFARKGLSSTGMLVLLHSIKNLKKNFYTISSIKSIEKNYIYIGFTENLERRINQHNNGQTKSTNAYRPFELIYSEECWDRTEAREKEKYYKSGVGKEFLKNLVISPDGEFTSRREDWYTCLRQASALG